MEPIGHIAGIGAAINGFISTIMAVPIATFIGGYINETALPLFAGFFACGFIALMLIGSLIVIKKRKNAVIKPI
jgi:DHA1 family bicyclomycin/chloramphenicol resistance-like MFS transporter